jgi:hypothetical protein
MRSTPEKRLARMTLVWLGVRTFMSYTHLRLHGLEIIGLACLGLSAHALSGPLLEATDSFVHVHVGMWGWNKKKNGRKQSETR